MCGCLRLSPGVFICTGPRAASRSVVLLCLACLAAASALALLRLLPMSGRDKGIEILALRHLLLVLQCQVGRPVFAGTDRAVLAGLFHHLPAARLRRLLLLVRPGHHPAVASRPAQPSPRCDLCAETTRTPAHRPLGPRPGPMPWARELLLGLPQDPRRACSARHQGRRLHRRGDPSRARHPARARTPSTATVLIDTHKPF